VPPAGHLQLVLRLPSIQDALRLDNYPLSTRLPLLDLSLLPIFRALSIHHIVRLFGCLLLEQKILFHAHSLSLITRTCETFLSLLHPMQWEMVYVPIVPSKLQGKVQVESNDTSKAF
jgi:hypothetical protein